MSERRKQQSAKNKTVAWVAAGIVHAIIIAALLFNFTSKPDSIEAFDADKIEDTIKAKTVDESQILKKQEELKQEERDKKAAEERERKRLEELKKERESEQQRVEDLKKQQQEEAEKAAELEAQRKAIALKKKEEEEQRKKEEAERQRQLEEQRLKEQLERKQREEQRQREAAELERMRQEQRELEARREMMQQLEREESARRAQQAAQRAATLASKYGALIKEKVRPRITISPDYSPTLTTRMNVKLSSSGEVRDVRVIKSSGNADYDRAVETAIYASSPLPIPSRDEDPDVNEQFQDLSLNFSIDGR